MKQVSEMFISLAIDCFNESETSSSNGQTAAGLPVNGSLVNASTVKYCNFISSDVKLSVTKNQRSERTVNESTMI